jgi:hypothetical protein
MKKILLSFLATLFVYQFAIGAVMTSTNYSIQSDSINFGGGLSTSTNYKSESTYGEIATGPSSSANYQIKAGYQQMLAVFISISTSPVALTPSISSTGGGTANGSTVVTVTTDDPAGYELYIKASSTPALKSGINSFADYTPAGINPDFTFLVAVSASEFGFTPEGTDIAQKYKDNGSSCNAGSSDTTNACWNALSTSNDLIASKSSGNHPNGTATTLKFRAESGTSNTQAVGTYTATTTVTAIAL